MAPPPTLTVSQWADKKRRLSPESSAEPGQWRTDRAPYQREMMDAINDSDVETVVIMCASQLGKSEIINNIIGYYIDCDPGPMLMIQPSIDMAQDYSKRRIAPMIRDTEALAQKVADSKTRDLNNTILMKSFPGGFLAMGGANSPAGLASRPIRILLADEIDRYAESAGSEGDPLALAEKRTVTFWNRKKIYTSSPGIKGVSRIEQAYTEGTRERWCKECPGCGEYQYLSLYGTKFQHEKDENGNYRVWDLTFQCSNCLEKFDELTWKNQPGAWIADNPEARKVRSFKINAFSSPWASWQDLCETWLKVKKDPDQYKVYVNTILGEPWEEKGEIEDYSYLLDRREEYPAELPDGVLILTAGVDVQDDRLEYEIIGWGKGERSWGIEYGMIMGCPDQADTWRALDDKLSAVYHYESGIGYSVACACVDSGGHFTTEVYQWCKAQEHRRIFAIKGMGGPGIPLIHRIYRSKKENAAVFILGVDSGKSRIMSRLKMREVGDGFCHFPLDEWRGYDEIYFRGLISERLVRRKSRGQIQLVWEKTNADKRNEPLDVRNYGQAALQILNPNMDLIEKRLRESERVGAATVQLGGTKQPRKRGVVSKGIKI